MTITGKMTAEKEEEKEEEKEGKDEKREKEGKNTGFPHSFTLFFLPYYQLIRFCSYIYTITRLFNIIYEYKKLNYFNQCTTIMPSISYTLLSLIIPFVPINSLRSSKSQVLSTVCLHFLIPSPSYLSFICTSNHHCSSLPLCLCLCLCSPTCRASVLQIHSHPRFIRDVALERF